MKKLLKSTVIFCAFLVFGVSAHAQVDLTGVASVNVTSDTASNAKLMAFNEARRQVATDVLSNYSETEKFNELMKTIDDASLAKLVSSTSIDSERLSTTTYSANIKISLALDASKRFLDENGVQNWLTGEDASDVDMKTVVITMNDGLRDWITLNHAIGAQKINTQIKNISGNEVIVLIPVTKHSDLISVVRGLGWKYSDANGDIQIWK